MSFGDVAQLARATGSYPVGREFESLRRYQIESNLDYLVQVFLFNPCTIII